MTKVEKEFRKALRQAYFGYKYLGDIHDYCLLSDLAQKLFPNINIDLCETRWNKEWKKENESW